MTTRYARPTTPTPRRSAPRRSDPLRRLDPHHPHPRRPLTARKGKRRKPIFPNGPWPRPSPPWPPTDGGQYFGPTNSSSRATASRFATEIVFGFENRHSTPSRSSVCPHRNRPVAGVALHLGAADALSHQDFVVGPFGPDRPLALLDKSRPSIRAGDGELPYVLGAGASPRDTAIAQVQTQKIRVSGLVKRTSIAARTSSLVLRARSAPDAGAPLLDGAERDADALGNHAVNEALLGQLPCPVHR